MARPVRVTIAPAAITPSHYSGLIGLALFAGEMSAHYYFRENFYADNGMIPFVLVLEHLSKLGTSFSEMMAPYMAGHFMSGELNFKVKDIDRVIKDVRAKYHGQGTEDFTDGFSLETPEWRFNVFGKAVAVTGLQGRRQAFYLGAEGKRRPADFVVPADITDGGLAEYLADLFHEHATPRNPAVTPLAADGNRNAAAKDQE